ncbi:MAG TPA: amidohydrolase family protein [Candidatus Solibacter sp.]|nr:amidohydrolase family protein [Candidatus Solibacter sp.]
MIIDSHQHFWHYDPVRYAWITDEMSILKRDFLPPHLLPELKSNGVDGCVAVQAEQSEEETHFLLELAEQNGQIMGVVGWVDLSAPNVSQRLDRLAQNKKLRGIRHIAQSEPDDWFLTREDFCRGIGVLKDFNLTYDILIYPKQLPAAIKLAERFPGQNFVLDHIAKPFIRSGEIEPWAANIRALAANPNVYCKVSGLVTEAKPNWTNADFTPYLDVVFEAFGSDRLMFGSDWPVCLVAADYKSVYGIVAGYMKNLPIAEQRKIFGLNAIRFYGLNTGNGS